MTFFSEFMSGVMMSAEVMGFTFAMTFAMMGFTGIIILILWYISDIISHRRV